MTTTGYIYNQISGSNVALIENYVDVIDITNPESPKIATVRDGNIYNLEGELLGHLSAPDGSKFPSPAAFLALLSSK